jgi:hypothetical protein
MATRRPWGFGCELVTAPTPLCTALQPGGATLNSRHGPPHPHQPQALRLRRPVGGRPSALVIPGGADSRVAAMHSLIAGVLPSHCGRETGGELRDMILQCPANYAATHAHRARLSRSSLMAN